MAERYSLTHLLETLGTCNIHSGPLSGSREPRRECWQCVLLGNIHCPLSAHAVLLVKTRRLRVPLAPAVYMFVVRNWCPNGGRLLCTKCSSEIGCVPLGKLDCPTPHVRFYTLLCYVKLVCELLDTFALCIRRSSYDTYYALRTKLKLLRTYARTRELAVWARDREEDAQK